MCGPITKVAVVAGKEEDLGVDLARSTGPTGDIHCLHPAIPVHKSLRRFVNYPVTWEVPVKILGVICFLVDNHRWHESLAISSGEDQRSTPEWGYFFCLGFPNAFPREELVGTDNSEP